MIIQNTLTILHYNVRRSKDTVMATLLREPRINNYDILAIQEPWSNPFSATTHHPAMDRFHICYPDDEEGGPARVCFFVNKRLGRIAAGAFLPPVDTPNVGTQGGRQSMASKMDIGGARQDFLPTHTEANQEDPSAP
jgi:hypothetical protein